MLSMHGVERPEGRYWRLLLATLGLTLSAFFMLVIQLPPASLSDMGNIECLIIGSEIVCVTKRNSPHAAGALVLCTILSLAYFHELAHFAGTVSSVSHSGKILDVEDRDLVSRILRKAIQHQNQMLDLSIVCCLGLQSIPSIWFTSGLFSCYSTLGYAEIASMSFLLYITPLCALGEEE
jgi:hypothetical protein